MQFRLRTRRVSILSRSCRSGCSPVHDVSRHVDLCVGTQSQPGPAWRRRRCYDRGSRISGARIPRRFRTLEGGWLSDIAPIGRPVQESVSDYSEVALPNDANPLGNLLGGRVMHLVDITGAIAAVRHARAPVVTASVDYMT